MKEEPLTSIRKRLFMKIKRNEQIWKNHRDKKSILVDKIISKKQFYYIRRIERKDHFVEIMNVSGTQPISKYVRRYKMILGDYKKKLT